MSTRHMTCCEWRSAWQHQEPLPTCTSERYVRAMGDIASWPSTCEQVAGRQQWDVQQQVEAAGR